MPSDTPKRLHPISLLFTVLSHARAVMVPLLFAYFASNGSWIQYVILAGFFPTVAVALVKYFNYLYAFGEDQLVIRDGILTRNERHVRYSRIQNIDISQNLLHRMFGVAVVRLETASGGKPEAEISVLSLDAVEEMRARVFAGRRAGASAQLDASANLRTHADAHTGANALEHRIPHTDMDVDPDVMAPTGTQGGALGAESGTQTAERTHPAADLQEKVVLQLPFAELVRAGLISNRGFVVVAIAFGAIQQAGVFENSDLLDRIGERIVAWVSDMGWLSAKEPGLGSLRRVLEPTALTEHPVLLVLSIVSAILLFVVLVRLLSVSWTVVTLFGFTLRRRGDDLRTQYGLFTRVSATIPRHRIQLASTRRTALHRLFRRAEVQVETAGGSAENQPGGAAKLRVAPIVRPEGLKELLGQLLPGVTLAPLEWRPLSPKTFKRFMKRATVWTLLLSSPALFFLKFWGLLAIPALIGYFLIRARFYLRYTAYALTPEAILFKSGWWTQRMSIVRYNKIQAVEFVQSWFDRRYGMAAVALDTAGAGRIGHKVSIRYLEADVARHMLARLEDEAAQTDFHW